MKHLQVFSSSMIQDHKIRTSIRRWVITFSLIKSLLKVFTIDKYLNGWIQIQRKSKIMTLPILFVWIPFHWFLFCSVLHYSDCKFAIYTSRYLSAEYIFSRIESWRMMTIVEDEKKKIYKEYFQHLASNYKKNSKYLLFKFPRIFPRLRIQLIPGTHFSFQFCRIQTLLSELTLIAGRSTV